MQQADDFLAETEALYALVETFGPERFDTDTLFKAWTVNEILRHLHVWNYLAFLQIENEAKLVGCIASLMKSMGAGHTLRDFEKDFTDGLSGPALVARWREQASKTSEIFQGVDPKQRVKWAGPDMSARSSLTARQMETWAHGQAIFDQAGIVRHDKDRIRNIVVLGTNTFAWTYGVRSQTPPGPMPFVTLTAPSGDIWRYGEESASERIEGRATEFCQVVTQTRNVADTSLTVTGAVATDWMSKAQCFAGGVETPPAPGVRHRHQG